MAKVDKDKKTVEEKKEEKKFHAELLAQMSALATAGFGLVAALAWNSLIQAFVKEYIEPRIPGSGMLYQFIYALLITTLAVFITYQLSRLSAKFSVKKDSDKN